MKADNETTQSRRTALCEWLTANGINPSDVPSESRLSVIDDGHGQRTIYYDALVRTEDGRVQADPEHPDEVWIQGHTAACVVDPPEWLRIAGTARS